MESSQNDKQNHVLAKLPQCRVSREDTQLVDQPKKQIQTANVLRRCKEALPAVMGALIAAAVAVVLAKSAASAKSAVKGALIASEEAKVKKGIFFHRSTPDVHATCPLHSIL